MSRSRSYGPRPLSIMIALILVLAVSWLAEAKPGSTIKVDKVYTGKIDVRTLDPKTLNPTVDDGPLVITSQDGYDAFTRRIPKKEISKKSPASPSKDPLLAKPVIDFAKQVMVVVIHGDNMYEPLNIQSVVAESKRTLVRVEKSSSAGEMMAQPDGLGAYTAIVFAKPATPIVIEHMPAKATP